MHVESTTYFVYGMCVMFYSMMVWMFWRKGKDRLSRLIAGLMAVLDAECIKDLAFLNFDIDSQTHGWYLTNAMDTVIIPVYMFVLMELVKPKWLSWRKALLHEASFVILVALFAITGKFVWFDVLTVWGGIYGTSIYVLMFFLISRYNRQLKERFSYQENINLNWLRGILSCFFVILVVWTVSCYMIDANYDNVYMLCSLVAWMFVSYFLYRHESVLEELSDCDTEEDLDEQSLVIVENDSLVAKMNRLFLDDKVYLNPRLKLSDVARLAGTNRTYVSRYFNQKNGQTFYDYVNNLRIRHAEELVRTSALPLMTISVKSGFNSLSTFRRVFASTFGCSPAEYRQQNKK